MTSCLAGGSCTYSVSRSSAAEAQTAAEQSVSVRKKIKFEQFFILIIICGFKHDASVCHSDYQKLLKQEQIFKLLPISKVVSF